MYNKVQTHSFFLSMAKVFKSCNFLFWISATILWHQPNFNPFLVRQCITGSIVSMNLIVICLLIDRALSIGQPAHPPAHLGSEQNFCSANSFLPELDVWPEKYRIVKVWSFWSEKRVFCKHFPNVHIFARLMGRFWKALGKKVPRFVGRQLVCGALQWGIVNLCHM